MRRILYVREKTHKGRQNDEQPNSQIQNVLLMEMRMNDTHDKAIYIEYNSKYVVKLLESYHQVAHLMMI